MVSNQAIATLLIILALGSSKLPFAQGQIVGGPPRYSSSSPNFTVYANQPEWAKQVTQVAEEYRRALAKHWLGTELPQWSKPCILFVQDNPRALASGETHYTLVNGAVINFKMTVRGTRERILDSVLPHEVTHTIIASHFAPMGRPVPRWADEGMCTTVEHAAERRKHDHLLVKFLDEGKGLPFATLFLLEDYPDDPLPLYAQGYSLTSFLIAQGGEQGPQTFIRFLEAGMKNNDWVSATKEIYGYPLVGKLQTAWIAWVNRGGNDVSGFTAEARGFGTQSLVARLARSRSNDPAVQPAVAIANNSSRASDEVLLAQAANASTSNRLSSQRESFLSESMHPSSGSYYLDKLRMQQSDPANRRESDSIGSPTGANEIQSELANIPKGIFVPAVPSASGPSDGTQHSVSQPSPMQTIGGTYWR